MLDKVEEAESYFLKTLLANAKFFPEHHIQTLQLQLQYAKFLKYWKRFNETKNITQEVKAIMNQENYDNATLIRWVNDLEKKQTK